MKDRRPAVVLLAAPSTSDAVLYGLYDVLFSAGAVFADMTLGVPGTESLNVRIVSLEGNGFDQARIEPQLSSSHAPITAV